MPKPPSPAKPLGRKAYGSIPHLPGSRTGPADHSVNPGQARICEHKLRSSRDRVIVTEKLDGSNVAIARIGRDVLALNRSGYLARTSPYLVHQNFAAWVEAWAAKHGPDILHEGEVLHLEWLSLAHGTIYELETPQTPFAIFDISQNGERLPFDRMLERADALYLPTAHVLSDGPPLTIPDMLALLGERGHHGAQEPAEGAVWRVERAEKFDFAAKYVRPEKIDGKYLPDISGGEPIWLA